MTDQEKQLAREIAKEVLETIEPRLRMHFEGVDDLIRTAAEGYGMNLDRIERELAALNNKMDTKLGDHDRVLANHNDRITSLETRA